MIVKDFVDLGNTDCKVVFVSNLGRKILSIYYTYNNLGKKTQEKLNEIYNLKITKITPKIGILDKEIKSKYAYLEVTVFGYEADEKIAQQMWNYEHRNKLKEERNEYFDE